MYRAQLLNWRSSSDAFCSFFLSFVLQIFQEGILVCSSAYFLERGRRDTWGLASLRYFGDFHFRGNKEATDACTCRTQPGTLELTWCPPSPSWGLKPEAAAAVQLILVLGWAFPACREAPWQPFDFESPAPQDKLSPALTSQGFPNPFFYFLKYIWAKSNSHLTCT